jgi:hypothetical protein
MHNHTIYLHDMIDRFCLHDAVVLNCRAKVATNPRRSGRRAASFCAPRSEAFSSVPLACCLRHFHPCRGPAGKQPMTHRGRVLLQVSLFAPTFLVEDPGPECDQQANITCEVKDQTWRNLTDVWCATAMVFRCLLTLASTSLPAFNGSWHTSTFVTATSFIDSTLGPCVALCLTGASTLNCNNFGTFKGYSDGS